MLPPTSDFTTIDGELCALLLAPPNLAAGPVTVELTLPTETTKALSGRQTRRNFARFMRYSEEYTLDTMVYEDPAKASSELRLWLTRLKGDTVAVPLWMDGIEFADAVNPGDIGVPITGDLPVRYGNYWVVINEASDSYEIVNLLTLSSTLFTIVGGFTLPWSAGTIAYPLIFGRLTTRPKFKAETDELLNGKVKIKENSTFARRVAARAIALPTVGDRIPAFSSYKLSTVYPDYENLLDSTEADILYSQLGFIRQEQQHVYQQPPRRALEYGYALSDRDEINALEYLFTDRRGTTKVFFQPTFRGDMRLFSDLPDAADDSLIPIEPSRYEDPDYAQFTEGLYIALFSFADRIAPVVQAHKIETIDLAGLHTQLPVSLPFSRDDTIISHLVLGCFAEPTLSWSYAADGTATTTLKVVEQTSEYVTPNPDLIEKAYLFTITEKIPTPGTPIISLFTSYELPIAWTGFGTFNPGPFSFDRITGDLQLGDKTTISTFDFLGNPLAKLLASTNEGPFEIVINEVSVDNPNDGTADEIFRGEVNDPEFTGKEWKLGCQFAAELDEEFGFYIQAICNVPLFSPKCSLLRTDFQSNGTIESMSGLTVVLSGIGDNTLNQPDHYFAIGDLRTGTGANFETREISESIHTVIGLLHKQTLTLKKPLFKAIIGQLANIYPGCDGTGDTCRNVFNNKINFRGHDYVPINNPSANIAQIQTDSGGKKG